MATRPEINVFPCKRNLTSKYVRAFDAEHAALVFAHWLQIELGTAPTGWITVKVNEIEYRVQLSSGYAERV